MSGLKMALMYELDADFKTRKSGGRSALVQFNPETLKVSYANQLAGKDEKASGSQADGTSGLQYVGAGSTKLSLQLWFDITAPLPGEQAPVDDVRRLTQPVANLMSPQPSASKDKFIPPAVCFEWGSFKFAGIIDALEESLEFFSDNGVPLRASIALSMSQQSILVASFDGNSPGFARPFPGTSALTQASAGSSLQALAAASGQIGSWQGIAAANGIENPRRLEAGQFLDLSPSARRGT